LRAFVEGRLEEALSKLEPDQGAMKAEIHFALCRRAMAVGAEREAGRQCDEAFRLSGDPRAGDILRTLEAKTKRCFLEGYVMESSNPDGSVERYRKAQEEAPPGSLFGEKARRKLEADKPVGGR
jgi:hypothetical protein